jgi:hypothetical protein
MSIEREGIWIWAWTKSGCALLAKKAYSNVIARHPLSYCRMRFKSEAICVRRDYRLVVSESHFGVISKDDAVK